PPNFLAGRRFQAMEDARGTHSIHPVAVHGRRGTRTRTEAIDEMGRIAKAPVFSTCIRVPANHGFVVAVLKDGENPAGCHGETRKALAGFGCPQLLRPLFGPVPVRCRVSGNAISPWSTPLRPIVGARRVLI